MTRSEARTLLGAAAGEDAAAVKRLYAEAVTRDHPDYGGTGTNIRRLQEARDMLLESRDTEPCAQCRGRGTLRATFGVQTCTACKGTGDRNVP